jgi:hypothetical protein
MKTVLLQLNILLQIEIIFTLEYLHDLVLGNKNDMSDFVATCVVVRVRSVTDGTGSLLPPTIRLQAEQPEQPRILTEINHLYFKVLT